MIINAFILIPLNAILIEQLTSMVICLNVGDGNWILLTFMLSLYFSRSPRTSIVEFLSNPTSIYQKQIGLP